MQLPNQKNAYLKTQVETASKEQLVVMLFDGIIRFTEQARNAINDKKIEDSHRFLVRAQAIIMELICTIDKEKGGEVAQNLLGLHAYAFNCLVICNLKKDVSKIDEVQNIYREIRAGWLGAMESLGLAGKNQPRNAPAPVSQGKDAVRQVETAASRPGSAVSPGKQPAPAKALAAGGYGMGKTAKFGVQEFRPSPMAFSGAAAKSAPTVNAPGLARHNAMLGAYSIAASNAS